MAQTKQTDFLIPALGVALDALAIELSFLFSYWIRFDTRLLSFLPLAEDTPPLDAYVYGSLAVIAVWLVLFNSRRMYASRRNAGLADELFGILKVVTLGMLIVMSAAFFYRAFSYSRVVFGLLWLTSVFFIFVGRATLGRVERSLYRGGRELRNAVIIGSTEAAERVYETLNNHPLLGYKILGYFARRRVRKASPLARADFIGTLAHVPEKLIDADAELVFIALNREEYPELSRIVRECEGVNVEFMIVPDLLEMMAGQMRVVELEGTPFIRLKGIPMSTWGRINKRLFDVVLSSILLVVASPILLAIAIAIKLDSKGPVLFSQKRVGIDGTEFEILKFRSMKTEAESETGPMWAREHDPRRTRVGKLLRSTSLDELPQLFNVFKGEMSLVGPRPERQFFVDQFREFVPKYLDRHRVKAGMTGWAQVNGLRGPYGTLEERVNYDLFYVENWSLWFDIKILLKTVRTVLSPGGAYRRRKERA